MLIKKIPLLLLFTVYLSLSLFKIFKVTNSKYFTGEDNHVFWTESAFQYRYARMISDYKKVPEMDINAEYPDGYNVMKFHPILMESFAGYIYRLIPFSLPFHLYIIILMALFSSLPVIAVYLLASLLWDNRYIGIFSALVYSITFSASMTMLNIAYEFQDFTLALIFFHIFFFFKAKISRENTDRIFYAFLSGALLLSAMASWHLTQFYYLTFLFYLIIQIFQKKEFDVKIVYIITSMVILGGIVIPVLSPVTFLTSIPLLLNYCIIITILSRKGRKWILIGSFIIIFALLAFLRLKGIFAETGFNMMVSRGIFPLIVAKLKGFGVRPVDGGNLSWEVLTLWVHPYNNPTLEWTMKSFGILLPVSIISSFFIIKDLIIRKESYKFIFVIYYFILFLFSYVLFERMDVFLIFFIAIVSGYFAKRYRMLGSALILIMLIPNLFILIMHQPKPAGPNRNYLIKAMRFIKNETQKNSPILSHFAYAPSILTWTGHPVVFHPKFESPETINKVKEFETLLFSKEDKFYKFCKQNRVRYFLLSSDMLLSRNYSSIRYRTHNLITKKESVIYRFHFAPEELKYFNLIYSNPHYRIFLIEYDDIEKKVERTEYYRVYDEKNFNLKSLGIKY